MSRFARASALALIALALSAPAALAFVASPQLAGEVRLPGITAVRTEDPARQRALDASPAWQRFRAGHGEWSAIWNEATATPHRAFGRGIGLPGFANDAASVDLSVRRFIGENPDLFRGAPVLRPLGILRHGDTWYASYRQTMDGLDVLFADWEFRVHESGRLTMFGADAAPTADAPPARRGLLVASVARESAKRGLAFDATRDRVESSPDLFVLPYPTEGGVEYRTVFEAHVITAKPEANWLTYVDARTGDVLLRINRVRNGISGTVTGTVHPTGPQDAPAARNFRDVYVTVGGTRVATDVNGVYTGAATGTVTVSSVIHGRFADINRVDAANASFSTSATNPATVNIPWGTVGISHVAERDAYYHVNIAHAHIKALDPGLTFLDYEMPVNVNIPDVCNASWNGTGLNFYAAGGGCVNTASVPDVVYHEYGHGVNDNIYEQDGLIGGMLNGSLHEGMADVYAAFLEDDPVIGEGFFGPGTFVRNLDNTNAWPQDNSGEVHTNGLIVGGSFWDLRQAVGLAVAEPLSIRARHGHPDDPFDFVAFREMFIEVLVADDNNGNLADGTPHSAAIIAAFNAHGIGTNAFLTATHTPNVDFTGNTVMDVTASFAYSGPSISALDPSSPAVHYRANRGTWQVAAMTPTGTPNQYRGSIAAPNVSVIEYYLTAGDVTGGTLSSPAGAPAKSVYRVVHGTQTTLLSWNMETDPGWVIGDPNDLAVTGIWERGDPQGTLSGFEDINSVQIQPRDDHTPNGIQCFVTGNGDSTQGAVFDDVDGGATTLYSAPFSALSGGVEHPVVEYWRWYSNNTGNAPGEDFWQVDISNNNGATWTSVENTNVTDGSWQRVAFRIEDYVVPTAFMKMRFIASDEGDGSLVEAAVDDFRLLAFVTGAAGVGDPIALPLSLATPFPNPAHGLQTVRFTLPEATHATLRVYDVTGRIRATLADADLPAGTHTVTWSGVDPSGLRAPAGVYFARLSAGGHERVQRIMRLN